MKTMHLALISIFAIVHRAALAITPLESMQPFKNLVGDWTCSGKFEATGKPINATIAITWDEKTTSLLVRHDDFPPAEFHDVELWGPLASGGFRAELVDAYSGVRSLSSNGWNDQVIEWTREEAGAKAEKFRYSQVSSAAFVIEWIYYKNDEPKLGDTLHCTKQKISLR